MAEMSKCPHDYDNPIRKGRAHYVCRLCGADITLRLALIQEDEDEAKGREGRMKALEGGNNPTCSKPRRSYTCTVCGKVGFWGPSWSYYGSIAHAEVCPADIPYSCSNECRVVVINNLWSRKWVLPKLQMTPGGGVVVKERKGY